MLYNAAAGKQTHRRVDHSILFQFKWGKRIFWKPNVEYHVINWINFSAFSSPTRLTMLGIIYLLPNKEEMSRPVVDFMLKPLYLNG